jgi:hypothetical protein
MQQIMFITLLQYSLLFCFVAVAYYVSKLLSRESVITLDATSLGEIREGTKKGEPAYTYTLYWNNQLDAMMMTDDGWIFDSFDSTALDPFDLTTTIIIIRRTTSGQQQLLCHRLVIKKLSPTKTAFPRRSNSSSFRLPAS